MRSLLYQAVAAIPAFGGRVYQASATGVGDVPQSPDKPFCVIREIGSTTYPVVEETASPRARSFYFWVYDERGSYVRIDELLKEVGDTVRDLVGSVSPSGRRCIGVNWQGESMDLEDDTYDANAKYGSARVTQGTL